MGKGPSRAYKLQLSPQGVQRFLRCHDRLSRAVGDLLSYGMTLFVAVSLLESCSDEELVDILQDPSAKQFGGNITRYVGTSILLSQMIAGLGERAVRAGSFPKPTPVWRLFLVAVLHMAEVEDSVLRAGYNAAIRRIETHKNG